MTKQLRTLARELRGLGYTVEQAKRSGHYHVRDCRGNFVSSISGTVSDRRAEHQIRTTLRKAGVPL